MQNILPTGCSDSMDFGNKLDSKEEMMLKFKSVKSVCTVGWPGNMTLLDFMLLLFCIQLLQVMCVVLVCL
jgi:hypothetical protein